jgi:ABC-type uncharacterized transport system permease subunit
MVSDITKTLTKYFLITFAFWYLLRQTKVGLAFSTDMTAIPQQLGVTEGLKSAIQLVK